MTVQVLNHGRLVWVNIEHPTVEDNAYLQKRFGFHPLALEDCLSHFERPKIDDYEDYLFVVMQFPTFRVERKVTRPGEVDFFIGPNFLVTVHDGAIKPVRTLWESCRDDLDERQRWMGKGAGRLLYNILDRIVDSIFPMLDKISGKISAIEEEMFTESMSLILQRVSLIRRDVIAFRRIVRAQIPVLKNLERRERPYIQEDLDVYFGDIADAFARASDLVEEYREVIEGLSATADSVTSHRINEVIRILTVFSVFMLPLTLVTSIFGMNVDLPVLESSFDFYIIMALMLLITISMLIYFRHRDWI